MKKESMELLIGDLIFKLGKANQQIQQLTMRVSQLEKDLYEAQNFPKLSSITEKKKIAQ